MKEVSRRGADSKKNSVTPPEVKKPKTERKTISFEEVSARRKTPSLLKIAEDRDVRTLFRIIKQWDLRIEAVAALDKAIKSHEA